MTSQEVKLYCANHPTVETTLRCNRCDKPICPKCAVPTPTGYRCKECVRGQQKIFDTATWYDYPVALGLAALIGYLGSLTVQFIGFFAIFLGPIVGAGAAEVVRFAIHKRRSRQLSILVPIAAGVGCLITPALFLLTRLPFGIGIGLLSLVWYGIYAAGFISTITYRLFGISITR